MTELKAFDPTYNYFGDLKGDELLRKEGKEYPRLKGLQRLAHQNRGGVKAVFSNIICTPAKGNKIASVTIQYVFGDGTQFSGSADATDAAHDKPYNLHLVAVAESKAEARALRRAFNISVVSADEIGSVDPAPIAGPDNGPIQDVQIKGIRKVGKLAGLNDTEILELIGTDKPLEELSEDEGRKLMKALNKYRKNN